MKVLSLNSFCVLLSSKILMRLPLFFSRNIANKMSWFTQLLPRKVIFCVLLKLSWTISKQLKDESRNTCFNVTESYKISFSLQNLSLRTITNSFGSVNSRKQKKTLERLLLIFMLHSHILRFYVCFRQAIKTESKLSLNSFKNFHLLLCFLRYFSVIHMRSTTHRWRN